jgi:hypothetical protein
MLDEWRADPEPGSFMAPSPLRNDCLRRWSSEKPELMLPNISKWDWEGWCASTCCDDDKNRSEFDVGNADP